MKILNAKENYWHFQNQLEIYLEELDDEDYYYGPAEFYDYLLQDTSNYENIDFVMNDNKFVGVLLKSDVEGINLLKLIGDFDSSIYKKLIKSYPNTIIFIDGYTSDEPFIYYNLANMKSSLGYEEYLSQGHMSFLIPNYLSENLIRDKIEELTIPEFDKEKLIFEDKTGSEILDEILSKYDDNPYFTGFSTNKNNHRHLSGFHYLSLDESDRNQKILLCKLEGQIVGAIKHGIYDTDGRIPHYGLAYIDVNINYRNKGIAKIMIKELNKYLEPSLPLFLTDESDMGKICHIEKLFLENVYATECVPYSKQEEYYKNNANKIQRKILDEVDHEDIEL